MTEIKMPTPDYDAEASELGPIDGWNREREIARIAAALRRAHAAGLREAATMVRHSDFCSSKVVPVCDCAANVGCDILRRAEEVEKNAS